MWTYRCRVVRVVDGDTVDVVVDLGFGVHKSERVRLADVDTPERGDPLWGEATQYTRAWLETHSADGLTLRSTKPRDKYGRYLAHIGSGRDAVTLNEALINAGLAQPWPA